MEEIRKDWKTREQGRRLVFRFDLPASLTGTAALITSSAATYRKSH